MLFGSSGIRRQYDTGLLDTARNVGAVIARSADTVLVGRDTRTTGPAVQQSLMAGIMGAGAKTFDCGIAPTPSVAYGTRYHDCGCMVTASHNPEEYNGIKLFNQDGSAFSPLQQSHIENTIDNPEWGAYDNQGTLSTFDCITPHTEAILSKVSLEEGMKVIVDCGCGAGCVMTPPMLSEAGVRVLSINAEPSGFFNRPSEPLEKNLSYIPALIRKTGYACALVHDGDADRLMAFDEKGRYIRGDHLLILFARYLRAKRVVTTYDASMAIEEFAEVKRTPVGDSYVSEQLIQWGDLGGEPSGAWIFPDISLCPDGPYAAALFCEMAAEWHIADEIDAMPAYSILRESIPVPDSIDILYALGATNPTDGLRMQDEDGWCLIRASGTEPKVRITAEGISSERAKEMLQKGRDLVRQARQER
ncbi:MAG: phosphopentomutase/phosphoglucosamine mutase [Methanospirillaceae archaeon]|nr:phosphopentomutase/phosphoglucosamine mutase [Methanospirillaceae archaeon]